MERLTTEKIGVGGHERVYRAWDTGCRYEAVIALHDTRLGPAVGGTRVLEYAAFGAALDDALRLSAGMTLKNALAGLPFGGGKAVILGPCPADADHRADLFRAHGRAIDHLEGAFITGEDVGTTPLDMEIIASRTIHVGGRKGGMGDPSPFTARGVIRAMEAACVDRWADPALAGRVVAIQGLGSVGANLARMCSERGARLIVADIDPRRVEAVRSEVEVEVVDTDRILETSADVLAPCALGGVLDARAVDRLDVAVVCGAANNQLADPEVDELLRARGVRYVPDYVANAGGVVSGAVDIAGWTTARMEQAIEGIFDTVSQVFERADLGRVGTQSAADGMARERLAASPGRQPPPTSPGRQPPPTSTKIGLE